MRAFYLFLNIGLIVAMIGLHAYIGHHAMTFKIFFSDFLNKSLTNDIQVAI